MENEDENLCIDDNLPTTAVTKEELLADFQVIFDNSDKNQKLTFERRFNKLHGLLKELEPINKKIAELMSEKFPLEESIDETRLQMVRECIHPENQLVHHGSYIKCKFCNVILRLNKKFL